MKLLIWAVMLIMFTYTIGFSITLWKEKSRAGSIIVLIIALAIAVSPFFTVLR
ncbi:hypothetical protein [Ornithinibacillus xuwenensis]|uniref:Uncharacterized protein n=1 Tax=Ornithinibacillus xuwenensis TaxID=3144668 RepID=A0ABU9XEE0_9BACI